MPLLPLHPRYARNWGHSVLPMTSMMEDLALPLPMIMLAMVVESLIFPPPAPRCVVPSRALRLLLCVGAPRLPK